MFPSKLDLTKDECRGALRRLELEAYSNVVSTFRAQGSLDSGKQSVLDQLRRCFHISEDRHKAEIRRVANNEKLMTISELINGKSYDLDWIREGHRTYPLISRAPSYSALHILADHASKVAAFENTELPEPNATRREKNLDNVVAGKHIITDDPNKPPSTSPAIFGVSRKDLKRSIDLVTLHPHSKKKHYHLKPPPPPNMKIHHLYQTLNTKRPRKSFTKKSSKLKSSSKQSPYSDDKHFDGAELQRHLTSQLMPPPMSPMKLSYTQQQQQQMPLSKKEMNMMKMNNQQMEPQAHYIPNNRLKNELLGADPGRARSARSKSVNVPHKTHTYSQKYSANGAGTRNNNLDHIPDPQIIFNTTSSAAKIDPPISVDSAMPPIENNEIDLSPAITSPLQLLSTAASCTPKLKVTSPVNHQIQQQQHLQPSTSATQLPTPNQVKTAHNQPTFKIIKPIIIKPTTSDAKSPQQQQTQQPQQQQQTLISTAPSKLKIQKIQLVVNKNQDGTTTSLSPSATIVSGKAGQLVLSGKGITNTYQVGTKSPYTILSSAKSVTTSAPKVMVQTTNFAQKEVTESERIPENQRITENTPIDFLPASTSITATNFPKVIIQKSVTSPKQIKLKLGPGGIMNSKIIKGPLPSNLKIQRNINTKGFTVLNTSQIVHIQSTSPSPAPLTTTLTIATNESTKTDWEQELDDVNRTKESMERLSDSNGASAAKKPRLEDPQGDALKQDSEVDESLVKSNATVIYAENLPEVTSSSELGEQNSEFVYLSADDVMKEPENVVQEDVNGAEQSTRLNGQFGVAEEEEEVVERDISHNGAAAYENLVKSLGADCESEYIKEISEDPQIEENFGLIDGNILESIAYSRESEGLF